MLPVERFFFFMNMPRMLNPVNHEMLSAYNSQIYPTLPDGRKSLILIDGNPCITPGMRNAVPKLFSLPALKLFGYDITQTIDDENPNSLFNGNIYYPVIWDYPPHINSACFILGNDFETITADQNPYNFNSTYTENDSFDNRSDDKGPEPEVV